MSRLILLIFFALLLSGCASTTGTFFNRPVVEDKVGDVMHTVSLSADRRTVIVARRDVPMPKFCAEPPPDTATAIKTDLDSSLKVKGNELGVKDKFDTAVTVLSARNAPLDAFRTGMFALCQFYLNGAMDKADIRPMFVKLLDVFESTQNVVNDAKAGANPAVAPTAGKTSGVGAARPASPTATTTNVNNILPNGPTDTNTIKETARGIGKALP